MSYNVLAISPGHNGSVCLLVDGKIELYIEEERFTRVKYDANPLKSLFYVLSNYHVDALALAGTGESMYPEMTWSGENVFTGIVRRFNPGVKVFSYWDHHHAGHATGAFYNSGFDTASAIIVDGAGSLIDLQLKSNFKTSGFETESIYQCSYPNGLELVYKSLGANDGPKLYTEDKMIKFNGNVNITKAYESITAYAGFHPIEAGKLMGLSSYGEENDTIPTLFYGEDANRNLFQPQYPAGGTLNINSFPELRLKAMGDDVNASSADIEEIAKYPEDLKLVQDIAWKIQQDSQRLVGDLIQKSIDLTGEKNIVISGGYGLNCVANYYYRKRFPDINLYVDPIANDGGTSIGLAKYVWYQHCVEENINIEKQPLTSLYLGIDRNDEVDEQKYSDEFTIETVTADDVAQLIVDQNIVSIFNGAAEAGPRALGNRSILFDPRTSNGKDIVNKVKGREWFRPFAGSILKEHVHEWFDMAGMDESSFMMYAVDVLPERIGQVTSITHVDNTCRIQTVTRDQNKYYYDLINAFKKLTGVPILFNTSFNLAGEPLVETFADAIKTLKNSELEYLYVPSKNIILKKIKGN